MNNQVNALKTQNCMIEELINLLHRTNPETQQGQFINVQKMIKTQLDILSYYKDAVKEVNEIDDSLVNINKQPLAKKYLIGKRGSGVTSSLLLEANKFDGIYMCLVNPKWIKTKCEGLGISVPEYYTFYDKDYIRGISKTKPIYIDVSRHTNQEDIDKYLNEFGITSELGYNIMTVGSTYED